MAWPKSSRPGSRSSGSKRLPHAQGRIDAGEQAIICVNQFRHESEAKIDVLVVDNAAVRAKQIEKLTRLKAERNSEAVKASLAALNHAARSGKGNLLDLAVQAARVKATVGEISLALERALGRHKAEIKAISGVYRDSMGADHPAFQRVARMTSAFAENDGRRPKILVAKMGQDGHDRGQKVIASAFSDLGFDVEIGPLFATPEEAAMQAAEGQARIIGVSSLAAGHLTLVPALKAALEKAGRPDIMIVVAG